MAVLNLFYLWTDRLLYWGIAALHIWALIDCAIRKAAAFPAVDKLTKPAWLAITGIATIFGIIIPLTVWPLSLIALIASCVYLADVRPAVREVSGGSGS